MNDLLTVKQAAKVLGVSPRQVRFLIHAKTLTSERPGNEWFVHTTSVEAYGKTTNRKKRKRECPECGGICRTTGVMKWGRYVWTCQVCSVQHFVYLRRVKMISPATQ